ncbi:hypothetical protein L1887_21251 [Cichorium endivia]|nr:hypothetical protein L1887_21251 [Cichorium endivia]
MGHLMGLGHERIITVLDTSGPAGPLNDKHDKAMQSDVLLLVPHFARAVAFLQVLVAATSRASGPALPFSISSGNSSGLDHSLTSTLPPCPLATVSPSSRPTPYLLLDPPTQSLPTHHFNASPTPPPSPVFPPTPPQTEALPLIRLSLNPRDFVGRETAEMDAGGQHRGKFDSFGFDWHSNCHLDGQQLLSSPPTDFSYPLSPFWYVRCSSFSLRPQRLIVLSTASPPAAISFCRPSYFLSQSYMLLCCADGHNNNTWAPPRGTAFNHPPTASPPTKGLAVITLKP